MELVGTVIVTKNSERLLMKKFSQVKAKPLHGSSQWKFTFKLSLKSGKGSLQHPLPNAIRLSLNNDYKLGVTLQRYVLNVFYIFLESECFLHFFGIFNIVSWTAKTYETMLFVSESNLLPIMVLHESELLLLKSTELQLTKSIEQPR